MIFPSNRVRVLVATKPVDFRKGHDGLAAPVKNALRKDPFTGMVFVFRARRADRLKLLHRDAEEDQRAFQWKDRPPNGLATACKRLEARGFVRPPVQGGLMTLRHAQFEALFAGLDRRLVRAVEAKAPEVV